VQDDLLDYLNNRIVPLHPLEQKGMAYENCVRKAGSERQALRALRQQVISAYRLLLNKLKAIRPRTKEVQNVHALHLRAAATYLSALSQMETAIARRSPRRMRAATRQARLANKLFTAFGKRLDELAKAHNVVLQKAGSR